MTHPSHAKRIHTKWTPEQRADYFRRVALEEAGREENLAYLNKLETAADEPGFSGDLRRAIAASLKPPEDLATEIGLDGDLLNQFCCGEAALPSTAIDRLVERLGLQLMATLR
jgi:hypothetical protein